MIENITDLVEEVAETFDALALRLSACCETVFCVQALCYLALVFQRTPSQYRPRSRRFHEHSVSEVYMFSGLAFQDMFHSNVGPC